MTLTCGFIGLGLIGGSIARALKTIEDLHITNIAYDTNKKSITQAYEDGVIDELVSEINDSFGKCDYIFLCAPVRFNIENAKLVKKYLKPGAVLTDVGSVKGEMHKAIHDLGLDDSFIGGHPMAGSERVGYTNSKAKLVENAYYILTKTEKTDCRKLEEYRNLVTKIGALPLIIPYEKHDYITAAISHVPHIIASSLVNLVKDSDSPDEEMKMIAAGGFKDITRIASSSATMWQQICLSNAENISKLLQDYIDSLESIKQSIVERSSEDLTNFFDTARKYRDGFIDASRGPIKTANTIHVEIYDQPGTLAVVATVLAAKGINVKNVGIIHNREEETGSLRVELHDEKEMESAKVALEQYGYSVNIG